MRINETERPGHRLKLLQHHLERPARKMRRGLIREQPAEAQSRGARLDNGRHVVKGEVTSHRNRDALPPL